MIDRPLAAQLAAKGERVARALAAYPSLAALRAEPVRAADTVVEYRTRAKLAVAPGPRIGLFARGTHDVLDLPGCRVLAPAIAASVAALRRLLAAPPPGSEPVLRAEGEGSGRLRAVDLREVHDERGAGVLLTLVLRAPSPSQRALDAACDALQAGLPALRAIAVSLHDGRSPQLLGAAPRGLRGAPLHRDSLRAGAPWSFAAPGGFAQAHRAQAAAIHAEIERALGKLEGLRALDVYAGSGALGLALAAAGARATLVEAFAPAAHAAERAAREQDLAARVEVHTATAEDEVPRLAAAGARFDVAIANPPRRGVAPRVREALAAVCDGPLVYVSCEPATLARDLAHWAQLGWFAERVVPFDLMPQTAEVECVALLRRGALPDLARALRGRRSPRRRQAAVPGDRPACGASGITAAACARAARRRAGGGAAPAGRGRERRVPVCEARSHRNRLAARARRCAHGDAMASHSFAASRASRAASRARCAKPDTTSTPRRAIAASRCSRATRCST